MSDNNFSIRKMFAVCSLIFGLLGAFIIVGNEFNFSTKILNITKRWKNIEFAINNLDSLKYYNPDESDVKSGFVERFDYIEKGDIGFKELMIIIQKNMPGILDSSIVCIIESLPITIGGIESRVINLMYEKDMDKEILNYHPITTKYEFYRWIRDYKHKCFLNLGMIIVGLSYMLNLVLLILGQQCDKKRKKETSNRRSIITRKHLNYFAD
jgi:hypothetical protein